MVPATKCYTRDSRAFVTRGYPSRPTTASLFATILRTGLLARSLQGLFHGRDAGVLFEGDLPKYDLFGKP